LRCFFFSSRRRHTISKRDWSSDVCSSDLLGHGADLYIMDATDRYQCTGGTAATAEQELDLTAGQAARAATAAGARQLMLTHFWPGNDRERSRADAAQHFTGEILLAGEGLQVPLG